MSKSKEGCTGMMPIYNNTVWNVGNMLREDISSVLNTQKEMVTMRGHTMLISLTVVIMSLCISNHVVHLIYSYLIFILKDRNK